MQKKYAKMKKRLLFTLVSFVICAFSFAQSMSDEQVVEYIQEQNAAGVDQKKIAQDLIARGITPDQLQRIRQKYQGLQKGDGRSSNGKDINRSRVNNGEQRSSRDQRSGSRDLRSTKREVRDMTNSDLRYQRDNRNQRNQRNQRDSHEPRSLRELREISDLTMAPTLLDSLDYEDMFYEEEKSKIFGHDIFRSKSATFEPNMNIATPASYVLGPGDEVIVDVFGAAQLSEQYTISPDGTIVLPNVGPVSVAGMTADQAQRRVRTAMGGHYEGSSIRLTVGQTRSILVNVMGEVYQPGTYNVSAFATVFNALYLAGGVNDMGTLRDIKVTRNGRTIATVDVYDYITTGRLTGNVMLRDNDVIIVGPYQNLVEMTGSVKRPMFYELKQGESLFSALGLAGGFASDAYKGNVRVERKSQEGMSYHNVNEMDFASFSMQDGDVVEVGTILERMKNSVMVLGGVLRPGQYNITDNVYSVRTLVEQAGGLHEQAFTGRAVLHRMKEDRTFQAISLNLENVMSGKETDVILQNEDRLIIGTNESLLVRRTVEIAGDVFEPGTYAYTEGQTVEDLILVAGGLTEKASLGNVEVSRRFFNSEENMDSKQLAKVFSLNIKNGLLADGDQGFTLMPFDKVTIHSNPNYHEQQSVTIRGEIMYEGDYAIVSKNERLSSIIKRAGGLLPSAAERNVILKRQMNEEEIERRTQLLRMARASSDSVDIDRLDLKTTYTIGVKLEQILANPGCDEDVTMRDGDEIYIPQLNNTVRINGEVRHANTVPYIQGKKASYYLNEAGGITKTGRKREAYIIYANGHVSKASKGKIEPGCEIIVPTRPEKKSDPTRASFFLSTASVAATIGAVLVNALRK